MLDQICDEGLTVCVDYVPRYDMCFKNHKKIRKITDEGVIENPIGVGSSGEEKLDDTTTLLRPLPEQIPI
jgi:hypothetical protein